jgi:hypothetical protein
MQITDWVNFIGEGIDDSFKIGGFVDPVSFAEKELDFTHDLTARQKNIDLSLTPYLKEPLAHIDFRGKGQRQVTICAPEQTGKSLTYQIGLIWAFKYEPCLSLVVYPSEDKCDEINRTKVQPLMKSIPELARELDMARTKAKNRYSFSSFTSFFQGAGERISAFSAKICVADELDDWIQHVGHANKLDDLKKRTRSFDDSLVIVVSSPKGEKSQVFSEFLKGSQGWWHLRCQSCKGLTIRSCDTYRLQFETELVDKQKVVIPGSCRLVCPKCGYKHEEKDKALMNQNGEFIHKNLLEKDHKSFQWGALASQWPSLSWQKIAEAQVLAGKTGSFQSQVVFDNSFRGLPFKKRKVHTEEQESVLRHCVSVLPKPEDLEAIFLTADTQARGWVWELRGLGVDGHRYQLSYGLCEYLDLTEDQLEKHRLIHEPQARALGETYNPPLTLSDIIEEGYQGVPICMGIIDEGGHRKKEVEDFVLKNKRIFSYKGGLKSIDKRWEWSKNQNKLILARRTDYQSELIYYLHFQDKEADFKWFLMPKEKITDEYIEQVCAVQKKVNAKGELVKDGDLLESWEHGDRPHDFFDTGMMYILLEEVAIESLKSKEFKHLKAPQLIKKFGDIEKREDKKVKPESVEDKKTFVYGWRIN